MPSPYASILTEAAYLPDANGELAQKFPLFPMVLKDIGSLAGWDAGKMHTDYSILSVFASAGLFSGRLPDSEQNFIEAIITALRVGDSGALSTCADNLCIKWGDIGVGA